MDTDLRLRAPLGKAARFGLEYTQVAGDISTFEFIDFWFRFPTGYGTPGFMFRPFHDKSRQDMAVAWELGADSSAFQLRAIYGLEDVFNNLWAFRQSRVGGESEPYVRHPWEPALLIASRHERWRAEVSGKYLTPSVKSEPGPAPGSAQHHVTLWGTWVEGYVEGQSLGLGWELHGQNRQARSTDQPLDYSTGDGRDFRRSWTAEAALRRALPRRLTAEARWQYTARAENYGPPVANGAFAAVDRVLQLEVRHQFAPGWVGRVGGLYDEITIANPTPFFSYGSRHESRAYFGLAARFGRVSMSGVEGIELDPEPYPVWFHHDKAFLNLQTTF